MRLIGSKRRGLVRLGLYLAGWLLLILALAGYLVLGGWFSWEHAIRVCARDWLPWVLLTPLVFWLARRFPLERRMLAKSVPAHVVGCALSVLICGLVADRIQPRGGWRSEHAAAHGSSVANAGDAAGPNTAVTATDPSSAPLLHRSQTHRQRLSSWLWWRARFNVPIYWVIVSLAHALTYYRRSQERERKTLELAASLAQARLQALQMQLHPHFLFNTLNAVATLVHKDPKAADDLIANLSDLLRQALDSSEIQEVTLRKELEFLDSYLEIEKMRLGDRLRVEKEIDPSLLDALVPVMILQPLVENAIRHGIEPKRLPGIVSIQVERRRESLVLTVSDDGVGTRPSNESEDRPGVGLANTRARLQELYGDRGRLFMQVRAEGGLAVEVHIPTRTQPAGPLRPPVISP